MLLFKNKKRQNFAVFFLFFIVCLIFFFPLLRGFSTKTVSPIDALNLTWNLNTIINNFPALPEKLLEGNIYYPYKYSAAYTDPLLTDALIAFLPAKIIKEPLVAFNFNLILSQILFLFFTFLFFNQFASLWLSFLFSLIFSFSAIRLHYFYVGHLNMFSLYWIPLAGFFLVKLAQTKKPFFIYLFFLCSVCQTLNSFLGGYFIIFFFLGLISAVKGLKEAFIQNLTHFFIGIAGALLFILPVIFVYLKVERLYEFSRTLRDAIHFSLSPEQIVGPNFFSPILFLVFILCLGYFFWNKARTRKEVFFLCLSIFFFVLALGPALHWLGKTIKIFIFKKFLPVPLPYAIFYYLLPGFKGFRTPSRWIFMFGFLATCFSCLVAQRFLKNRIKLARYLFVVVFMLFWLNLKIPQKYFDFPLKEDYPQVYHWLKNQPGRVIAEIPFYYWGDEELGKIVSAQMIFSLFHQKKILGGYCSFSPKEWEELIVFLRKEFPSVVSLLKIKELGVDYLVLHLDELRDFWPEDYQKKMEILTASSLLRQIYKDEKDVVYSF